MSDTNKAKGTLLGGAVGDAIGAVLEFSNPGQFGWDKPVLDPIKKMEICQNYGGLALGQVTDDTAMAICMWLSLNEKKDLVEDDIATRYRAWEKITFDAGGTTRSALKESVDHGALLSGLVAWSKAKFNNCGNGSLMRAYTLPVFMRNSTDIYDLVLLSIRESAITHADPRCAMAVAAYNVAIHALINGSTPVEAWHKAAGSLSLARELTYSYYWHTAAESKLPEKHVKQIQEAAGKGSKLAFRDLAGDLVEAAYEDPQMYGEIDPDFRLCGGSSSGFVRVGFRLAFWELLHAKSYEEGILDTVNRGGDSDTNGSIVGAMLGARFGLEGIPADWIKAVLECKTAHGGDFDSIYHPRLFVEQGWETQTTA